MVTVVAGPAPVKSAYPNFMPATNPLRQSRMHCSLEIGSMQVSPPLSLILDTSPASMRTRDQGGSEERVQKDRNSIKAG